MPKWVVSFHPDASLREASFLESILALPLLPEICTWHHCEALTFCICNKHRRLHADEVDPVRLEDL